MSSRELVNYIESGLIWTSSQKCSNEYPLHFFFRARYALYYTILKLHKKYPDKKRILLSPLTIPEIPAQLKSLGFELIYCDVKYNTLDPDWDRYDTTIKSKNLLCIIITDYYKVVEIPQSIVTQGVYVVRDRALSFGVEHEDAYKNVISIYSFSAYKKINTLLGGAIQIDDKNLERVILNGRDLNNYASVFKYFNITWKIFLYYLVMTYMPSVWLRNLIFTKIISSKPYQRSRLTQENLEQYDEINDSVSKFATYPNPIFLKVIINKISKLDKINSIYSKNYKSILRVIEKYPWAYVIKDSKDNTQTLSFIIMQVNEDYSKKLKKVLTNEDKLQILTPLIYPFNADFKKYPNLSIIISNLYKVPINSSLTNIYFQRLDSLLSRVSHV
jgi:hypothetical protein